jgi:Tfp pilus assembly protein PilF
MRLCRQCFERAIELDTGYALPYVALADFYSISALYGFLPPGKSFPEAHRLLSRALTIDSGFGAAHSSLGWVTFLYDWDWAASRKCFRQALALSPNHSTTNVWYALCLSWAGEADEAMDRAERAYLSDPISPLVGATRGVLLYQQRQHGAASEQFRRVLQACPDYTLAHAHLARALILDGQYEQAALHATTAAGLGMPFAGAFAAFASARAGDSGKASAAIKDLIEASRKEYVSPVLLAYLYVALEDRANALRWFGEAKRIRDPLLCQARADPLFTDFRSAPELQAT